MLFLFTYPSTLAQEISIKRSHPISLNTEIVRTQPARGTLDVVAVMVEFQADSNRLTSGTGIFGPDGYDGLPYLANQEVTYIDPLPHNRGYFEAHLEFAKNYYLKASDGQLTLNYQVLPQVISLDKPMEEYAPIGEEFTLEKIAFLMRDVWQAVDENDTFDTNGLDPDNTLFVIFHAGIGRDVELTGTSLDITPYDLPSISLNKKNLGELLDEPSFAGFGLNNDSFRVTNSMLMPRTQSRRGVDISDNEIVFPLSINGLLCASIGSYLGLPDLFNTSSGEPAIGRFALMDGAGFFAYNGLLPPEPSAWEKVFLGWETPFDVSINEANAIQLPAVSLDQPNSIAKISLSATEYFLIENRHRDPNLPDAKSASVTISTRDPETGQIKQKTFDNFDEDFIFLGSNFDELLDRGTIVDVSNFDWSLPGGIDPGEDNEIGSDDDRHLNGGILIWHIDEQVIKNGLINDNVNANELLRGVDLEEGDGAQDIGRDPGLLDNSPSFGFAYDFWFAGNDYRVITLTAEIDLNPDNKFGPETYPNNNSNSGGRSNFELYEFSENLPIASFRIRPISSDFGIQLITKQQFETDFFTPKDDYWDYFPLSLKVLETGSANYVVGATPTEVLIIDTNNPDSSKTIASPNNQQPVVTNELFLASMSDERDLLTVQNWSIGVNGTPELDWESLGNLNPNKLAFLSSVDESNLQIDFTKQFLNIETGLLIEDSESPDFRTITPPFGSSPFINGSTVQWTPSNTQEIITNAQNRLFIGSFSFRFSPYSYLFEDGNFSIIAPLENEPPYVLPLFEEEKAEWPAIIDEGHILRVNRTDNTIEGYNFSGARLSNTPIPAPDGFQFIGTPIVADITGDNKQDLLVVGQSNYSVNIFGYELNGSPIEGFPLYVGGSVGADVQPVHPVLYNDMLYAVSHTGDFKAWQFEYFTSSQWPTRYGENPYNKVSATIDFSDNSDNDFLVLNSAETYNWPNPADDHTYLRFELADAGTVEITVIDYSGRVVFEHQLSTIGGIPQEILIRTDQWGSGAYFARVKATIAGKEEVKIVKIGVAH